MNTLKKCKLRKNGGLGVRGWGMGNDL